MNLDWIRCAAIGLFSLATAVHAANAGPASPWAPSITAGPFGGRVNPFIGTGGIVYVCGNVFPGATTPFGMVRLNPDTISLIGRKATNMSGYYYRDEFLMGFSHTRLSGTGAIDGGHFLVMPDVKPWDPVCRTQGLRAKFSHDDEAAFPGYYGVKLAESGVIAEMTATPRVGVHRYTFPAKSTPRIFLNVTNALWRGKSKEGFVRVIPDANELEGHVQTFGSFSSRYGGIKVYFAAKFDQPIAEHATWEGGTLKPGRSEINGDDVGAALRFPEGVTASTIDLKLAISYVSIANARANLEAEAAGRSFDELFAQSRDAWEQTLGRIRVEGGTNREQTIFYTALYRAFAMPTIFNDVNGDYIGFDGKVHQARGFTYYTDMSLWDTFRTAHPLYTLIAPVEQRDMLVSLVEMAKQGGYLPRWPSGHGYTNSMLGTPADMVVAESYLKGIRDFDVETAYEAMRKTALGAPQNSRFSGRRGIEDYLKFRYCPADTMEQAVSRTIEYSWSDDAVARLARALGKDDDARMFAEHARYYRNLWNPETQHFHPRDSSGKFVAAFRPELLTYLDFTGEFTNDYVEGSATQWRWAVPYDAEGLVSLFKSREYFVSELNEFFEKSTPTFGKVPNAYYWHGNQPDLNAAFLFNSAGRPDLTQRWSRWILEHKYGVGEDGLDGNDDGGTLSAWYVFASLGLYPIAGSDLYEIGSPIWKRAELQTGRQKLDITADGAASDRVYVQKMRLNDKPFNYTRVSHAEIANGATLHFDLEPNPPSKSQ